MKNAERLTGELVSRTGLYSFYKHIGPMPNPDKILGLKSIDSLRDLKNDAHVWSCIQSRKSGAMKLTGFISGGDTNVKEFINKILDNIDLYTLKRDILEAVLFGYQPLEIIWETGENLCLIPVKIVAKPQEAFYYDSEGVLYYRDKSGAKGEKVPKGKVIMAGHETSFINPYGVSLLSKCYWPVTFKNGGLRFWINFIEKFGSPTILGKYQRGASQNEIQELALALASLAQDSVLVSPQDVDLSLVEAARTGSSDLYKELIKQCNTEISKALLSQTLTTELDGGSYAAAQTHLSVRSDIIVADAKLIDTVINELIGIICEINYPGGVKPKYTTVCSETDDMPPVMRDIKLKELGVKFSTKYISKKYGLNIEEFEMIG